MCFVVFELRHKVLCGVLNRHKVLCGVLNRPQTALWCKF